MSVNPSYRPGFNNCHHVNALCPVQASTYGDYFNLGACVFFTTFYSIAFIYTTVVGIRGRTWAFTTFLSIGTMLELMGYAARIVMSPIGTVWNYGAFVIQLVMLILAPTLVAAAISVTFKWIVIQKGVRYSVLRPNLYPWIFVGTDFLSIIIQAIGGAVSATATGGDLNVKLLNLGSDLLVAGVAFQAANMAFCGCFMVIYWLRYRRDAKCGELDRDASAVHKTGASDPKTPNVIDMPFTPPNNRTNLRSESAAIEGSKFALFIYALLLAYVAVLIRCIYRIPEMAFGWGSTLMRNETLFLILDGAMVGVAVLALSIFHPAFFFPLMSKRTNVSRSQGTRVCSEDRMRSDSARMQ